MRLNGRSLVIMGLVFVPGALLPADDRNPQDGAGLKAQNVLERRGYIVPVRIVQISPEVNGHVVKLHLEEGKSFKKGELLAQLDPTKYELDFKRAQALVERARAHLQIISLGNRQDDIQQAEIAILEAKEQYLQLQIDVQQARAQPGNPDFARAKSRLRMAELQIKKTEIILQHLRSGPRAEELNVARAELAVAEAECAKARYLLECSGVRAPFDGTVLTKKAEVGSLVDPSGFAIPTSVCEFGDLLDLEVEVWIEERGFQRVFRGQKCFIRVDAFPETVYSGKVVRVLPQADRAKSAISVRVHIDLPNNDARLSPEMGAVVSFQLQRP